MGAFSATFSADLTCLSDITLCDNVLNFNERNAELKNARAQELDRHGQDCSAFVHLKREGLEGVEHPSQKRRRRPPGKNFPR